MKREDISAIGKMISYCEDIEKLLARFDNNFKSYEEDIAFQYACNMCIIQIGELVNRLSNGFMEEHPDIPWHAIRAMRNLHAHDYENIDTTIVWTTLTEEIPVLKRKLEGILMNK